MKDMGIEPTVYLFRVPGDPDALSQSCKAHDIQLERFDLGSSFDYYSLPGIIDVLRVNRYQLLDDIMATPLLTIDAVFNRERRIA